MEVAVREHNCSGSEERFAQLVAAGRTQTSAYRAAWGSTAAPGSAQAAASEVIRRPHVLARIKQLRQRMWDELRLSASERHALLAETARGVPKSERPKHSDRIRALELDARLAGDLTDRVRVDGSVEIHGLLGVLGGAEPPVEVDAVVVEPVVEPERRDLASGGGLEASDLPGEGEDSGSGGSGLSRPAGVAVSASRPQRQILPGSASAPTAPPASWLPDLRSVLAPAQPAGEAPPPAAESYEAD